MVDQISHVCSFVCLGNAAIACVSTCTCDLFCLPSSSMHFNVRNKKKIIHPLTQSLMGLTFYPRRTEQRKYFHYTGGGCTAQQWLAFLFVGTQIFQ